MPARGARGPVTVWSRSSRNDQFLASKKKVPFEEGFVPCGQRREHRGGWQAGDVLCTRGAVTGGRRRAVHCGSGRAGRARGSRVLHVLRAQEVGYQAKRAEKEGMKDCGTRSRTPMRARARVASTSDIALTPSHALAWQGLLDVVRGRSIAPFPDLARSRTFHERARTRVRTE